MLIHRFFHILLIHLLLIVNYTTILYADNYIKIPVK